jgi:hypothetical protein
VAGDLAVIVRRFVRLRGLRQPETIVPCLKQHHGMDAPVLVYHGLASRKDST